jgi:hypothetical protein
MAWICPNCRGNEGTLHIHGVIVSVAVYPEGAEPDSDLVWTDGHEATCSCGWSGTAGDCLAEEVRKG